MLCLKISETTYYRKNRETIINRAKKYDENYKERLREKTKNKYRELSEKKKILRENKQETYIYIYVRKKRKTKSLPKDLS